MPPAVCCRATRISPADGAALVLGAPAAGGRARALGPGGGGERFRRARNAPFPGGSGEAAMGGPTVHGSAPGGAGALGSSVPAVVAVGGRGQTAARSAGGEGCG